MTTQETLSALLDLRRHPDTMDNTDYGQHSNPSWLSFLRQFPSAKKYSQRIQDFLHFHEARSQGHSDKNLKDSMLLYFTEKHEEKQNDENRYCPTTLRSWLSMLTAFWKHTGRGDLKMQMPILEDNISKWERTHTTRKAKTFTEENLSKDALNILISREIFVVVYSGFVRAFQYPRDSVVEDVCDGS
jgi:hypothetical protein